MKYNLFVPACEYAQLIEIDVDIKPREDGALAVNLSVVELPSHIMNLSPVGSRIEQVPVSDAPESPYLKAYTGAPPKSPVNVTIESPMSPRDAAGNLIKPRYVSARDYLLEKGYVDDAEYHDQFVKTTLSLAQHAGRAARQMKVNPQWSGSANGRGDRLYSRKVWDVALSRMDVEAKN